MIAETSNPSHFESESCDKFEGGSLFPFLQGTTTLQPFSGSRTHIPTPGSRTQEAILSIETKNRLPHSTPSPAPGRWAAGDPHLILETRQPVDRLYHGERTLRRRHPTADTLPGIPSHLDDTYCHCDNITL